MRVLGLLGPLLLLVSCNSVLGNKNYYLVTADAAAADSGAAGVGSGAVAGGGSGGADALDPCVGIICNKPPENDCASATEFHSYDTIGSCDKALCVYVSHQITCACDNHACATDPCSTVTCGVPPSAVCSGSNTLTTYAASGTCSAGSCSYVSTDVPCVFGCSDGACKPDPCANVTCKKPPESDCASDSEFRSYDEIGSCVDGECSYASHKVACTCDSGACADDPCAKIDCNLPPADACTGSNHSTLTTYAAKGDCSAGSCSYAPTSKDCAFGCANGACNPDPCAGVVCDKPPGPICKTATTVTTYAPSGTCSAGACSYVGVDTSCGSNHMCTGSGVCS